MPTEVFGAGAVQTAYVSYETIDLTGGSVTLVWPNTYVNLPYTQDGINYNVLAASMNVITPSSNTNTITLPDATQATVGANFIITNTGSSSFNLLYSDGSTLTTISNTSGQNSYWIQLINNSTSNGTWQLIHFGAGTSSADASALAGNGLVALAGTPNATLNSNITVTSLSSAYTVSVSDRAKLFVWTGGTDTITLPLITAIPAGFYVSFNNSTSGTVTLSGNGTEIEGFASIAITQYQSLSVISDGTQWWTLGFGQNVFSNNFIPGSAANPSITFETDTSTGIYYDSTPYLGFSVSGGQVGQFTYDGGESIATFTVVNGTAGDNLQMAATGLEAVITSNNPLVLAPGTGGSVQLYNDSDSVVPLLFYDAPGMHFVGFQAATPLSSDTTWTLPSSDGANGQLLSTNGSAILSWSSAALPSTATGIVVTSISTGMAATSGQVPLNGTTGVTVATTAITASSIVLITHSTGTTSPTLANLGTLVVGSIVANTSFMIYSSNPLDTATANWQIINP